MRRLKLNLCLITASASRRVPTPFRNWLSRVHLTNVPEGEAFAIWVDRIAAGRFNDTLLSRLHRHW